ncbi:peptide chain release factor N(5)-glutamine methyltransferase [Thioalkalivibrio sp. AKL17]|uniref:peptide chain release factor N(5)-glutamine methyltransferase n=1 Tax=Thioalkalivibrio sp. AKL17 TaxID=1158160 RepID=UPI000374A907|nr:peptide chain release factor N(5)-glutamine methyltransferase [Thioalkalivibrio sp. AKL17]
MDRPATLDALLASLRNRLQEAGVEAPGLEARLLLGMATGLSTAQFIARGGDAPGPTQAAAAEALCRRRLQGEPIAHILGRRGFWTLDLGVSPACLIPRPETEVLVEAALGVIDAAPEEHPRVLDAGTGSGAIILALKAERPAIDGFASDTSLDALTRARANAGELNLNIRFFSGAWLQPLAPAARFDLIVSNPPYIAADDPHLQRGDLRFEPRDALVAAQTGLADLHELIATAPDHLTDDGWLLLEHGFDQDAAVRARLETGPWTDITTWPDTAGHPRVTGARLRARR